MISQYENIYLPKLYSNSFYNNSSKSTNEPACVMRLPNSKTLNELAEKLQYNWAEYNETEAREMDDSLTNLNWLHNVTSIIGPDHRSLSPTALLNQSKAQTLPRINIGQKNLDYFSSKNVDYTPSNVQSSLTHHLDSALKDGGLLDPLVRFDYKNNWSGKPPFSYATLICMAMRELNKSKITLSDIYGWITDNFIYYRLSDSSWQNSVRHNLSLNKCFEKVPRNKDERGKGGFWRINPKYADRLESNLIKYRRQFPMYGIQKISNGLPAASTLLSRDQINGHELHQIYEERNYTDDSVTTDNGWQNPNYNTQRNASQINITDGAWTSKCKNDYLPNISICNYSNALPPCAFNTSMATNNDISPSLRKPFSKISQIIPGSSFLKLQSLDEFRTSETGQKVDTQIRAEMSPRDSPTMYSLMRQINTSPSHLSFDGIDSGASSSFDTDVTGHSGSCATYQSNSDDHDESVRFNSSLAEDFIVSAEDYVTCDSYRQHEHLFSQFV